MARERRDNKGRLLLTGEAQIRNGSYTFRYTDENGVRKSITNWKLLPEDQPPKGDTNPECLRDMENRITDRRTKAMPKKTKTVNAFWPRIYFYEMRDCGNNAGPVHLSL